MAARKASTVKKAGAKKAGATKKAAPAKKKATPATRKKTAPARKAATKKKATPATRKKAAPARKTAAPARKAAAPARRADYGTPIEAHLDKMPAPLRAIADRIREVVRETVEGVEEAIKWGQPVFSREGKMFAYLKPAKEYLRLGFSGKGLKLHDPENKLEGSTDMVHIKLRDLKELNVETLRAWVQQAVEHARRG